MYNANATGSVSPPSKPIVSSLYSLGVIAINVIDPSNEITPNTFIILFRY